MFKAEPQATNENDEILDPADALEEYWRTQEAVAEDDKKKREDVESRRLEESVQAFKSNADYAGLPDDFVANVCAFLELVGNPISREWTISKWNQPQAWLVATNPKMWVESSNAMPSILSEASERVKRWKNWRRQR